MPRKARKKTQPTCAAVLVNVLFDLFHFESNRPYIRMAMT